MTTSFSITSTSTTDFSSFSDFSDPSEIRKYIFDERSNSSKALDLLNACFFCTLGSRQKSDSLTQKPLNQEFKKRKGIFSLCRRRKDHSPSPLAQTTKNEDLLRFNALDNQLSASNFHISKSSEFEFEPQMDKSAISNERMNKSIPRGTSYDDHQLFQLDNDLQTERIEVCVDTEKSPSSSRNSSTVYLNELNKKIEMTPVPLNLDDHPKISHQLVTKSKSKIIHTDIGRCIKSGHLNCIKNYISRVNASLNGQVLLHQSNDLSIENSIGSDYDKCEESPPPNTGAIDPGDEDFVVSVRRQFVRASKINSSGFIGPYQVLEFKQRCSPIIWALDCLQWEILRLLSVGLIDTLKSPGKAGLPTPNHHCNNTVEKHLCLYPDRPQNITRKLITKKSIRLKSCNSRIEMNGGIMTPQGSPGRIFGAAPAFTKTNRGLAALLDPRQLEKDKAPKNNGILPANSWSSLALPMIGSGLEVGLSPIADMMVSLCSSARKISGSHQNLLTANSVSGAISPNSPQKFYTQRQFQHGEATMIVLPSQPENKNSHSHSSVYHFPWIVGTHTYQSILDYYIASGYEMVGCETSYNGIQNCRRRNSDDTYLSECYPAAADDPRNDLFAIYFSRLPRVIKLTGVMVNRIDAVMAFNAILTSAGRRLCNWIQQGAELDTTVAKSRLNRCLNRDPWWINPTKADFGKGPVFEWRIISMLIENGLNEFEWLDFQSPQFNLIGQILCVFMWPVYGWTRMDAVKHFADKIGNKDVPVGPNFGQALRKQACMLLANLWSLGAFQPYDNSTKSSGGYKEDLTAEGGELKRAMLKGGGQFMADSDEIDALYLTQKWSKLQHLWQSSLNRSGIEAISESLQFLKSTVTQSEASRRDSYAAAGASRSNSGSWEVNAPRGSLSMANNFFEIGHDNPLHLILKSPDLGDPMLTRRTLFGLDELDAKHGNLRGDRTSISVNSRRKRKQVYFQPTRLKLLCRRVIRRYLMSTECQNRRIGFSSLLSRMNLPDNMLQWICYIEKSHELSSIDLPIPLNALFNIVLKK